MVHLKKIFTTSFFHFIWISFIAILIGFAYLYNLEQNPPSLYCDEAILGYRAYQVLQGNFQEFYNIFFYRHFSYVLGSLSVFVAVPFVFLFGMNDFAIRFTSVFFGLASLLVIYLTLRKLQMRFAWVALVLTAFTPIFYHLSRPYFGYTAGIFFVFLGYYFYVLSKEAGLKDTQNKQEIPASARMTKQKGKEITVFFSAIGSGIAFGISLYGPAVFILATPLFILAIGMTELLTNRLKWRRYETIFLAGLVFMIMMLPVIREYISNQQLANRYKDKTGSKESIFSQESLKRIKKNYSKYFSHKYLFTKGEIDMPGSFISRHSVRGNGELLSVMVPIMLLGFLLLFHKRIKHKQYVLPFFIYFFLNPIPDALTSLPESPPYSFSFFPVILIVPFIAAYVFDYLAGGWTHSQGLVAKGKRVVTVILIGVILYQSGEFMMNYQKYPSYSADYWGWQYGPKQIISYFQEVKGEYDDLYLTGFFNEAGIFLLFYDPQNTCPQCHIGSYNQFDPARKQIFALRVNEFEDKDFIYDYVIKKRIYLPDGKEEYRIVELKRRN